MANLLLVSGLACTFCGAIVLYASHRSVLKTAARVTAGYPRVLATLNLARHDRRFGLAILTCGLLLQGLAAYGYAAPMSVWRFPVFAGLAAVLPYGVWRSLARHWLTRSPAPQGAPRAPGPRVYETRRSYRLRQAAIAEAPALHAREIARSPQGAPIVCLGRKVDQHWWSDRLGVSVETLRAAVRQVGPMTADVERFVASARGGLALA